jgi:ribosomal protein S8
MSSRYPVAEMVTTINVAIRSHAFTAFVRRSNFIVELANVLYLNGFIQSFSIRNDGVMIFRNIKIVNLL